MIKDKIILVGFLIILFLPTIKAIVINEILPNPEEYSDAEWIELYSNEILNLSGWKLDTTGQTYTFGNVIIADFLIVTKNKTSFLSLWPSAPQEKIIEWTGMGLNNGGESVSLLNQSTIIDTTTYPSFSSHLGKSWARLENGTFVVCSNPTPLAENNCSQQQEKYIELIYPQEVECNENFSITFKAFNFEDGIYDIKIDILDAYDETHRIGKVWNGTKWLSTNSYVNSVLNVTNGNGTATLTYKVENFEGEAILRPRIRKTNSSTYEQFDDYSLLVNCEQSNQEESFIKIIDAPDEAKFGDEIEIELEVYKGDTTKYAVYVYVQDENEEKVSDKITLHFYDKFANYEEKVSLTLKCKNEKGIYEIVAEGLDTKDTKEIELTECNESVEENASEGITMGDFTYIINVPNTIYINKEFSVEVKIMSKASQEQEFLVWSYVYRGSVCYSCSDTITRESNAKAIVVQPNSFAEVELQNIVKEAELGTYKIKIKVQQQGLKTPKEFSYDIILDSLEGSLEESSEGTEENIQTNLLHKSSYQTHSQYSHSQTIKTESFSLLETLPYILVSTALILAIYLVIKKI